jgi:hypothetical protein
MFYAPNKGSPSSYAVALLGSFEQKSKRYKKFDRLWYPLGRSTIYRLIFIDWLAETPNKDSTESKMRVHLLNQFPKREYNRPMNIGLYIVKGYLVHLFGNMK